VDDQRLRVLIVDDTVVYRRILSEVVDALGEAVVGTAPHGRLALAKLEQTAVDLVLLDVEMPEMNGHETLREIHRLYPGTSVVMISGSDYCAAESTTRCLEQGALDFLHKPEGTGAEAGRQELMGKLRPLLRLVRTRINLYQGMQARPAEPPVHAGPPRVRVDPPSTRPGRMGPVPTRIDVVGIGISTGGPNALAELIPHLPADFPVPILVVQHMPPLFTASLAEHLNQISPISVHEARDGEPVLPGCVYLAPGGRHMVVRRLPDRDGTGSSLIIGLNDNPLENSCRPSVDVLFRSLAAHFDGHMLAVVMTGMGSDGCEGVRAMKRRGCLCLTQSETSCIVYGMPLSVDEAELSDEQVPLVRLADRITRLARKNRGTA
jgi:two-component system chemotaxis response regulator CheB